MSKFEFDSICRLCVKIFEKEKVSPIFNNKSYDDKISLPERIRYCSSIEVAENDGLPPQICNTCLSRLNESFVFRNQCVLADITLKRLKDFRFNVDEIPNLSKVDIENQIIKSENDDSSHPSLEIFNGSEKTDENIDEFDNSKNGRHKRNIHKLKSVPLQKKNIFDCIGKLEVPKTNLCFLPDVLKTESESDKKERSNEEKIQNARKLNKMKQFLKTNEKLPEDLQNVCRSGSENVPLNVNIDGKTKDFNKTNIKLKSIKAKVGKKRKIGFTKEKPSSFKCDYCEKVYPSEGGWRYHIHTMHNENYLPFICDLCGQAFKVKKNLEAHKNSIHFHLKHHLCDLCGRGFASKYSLKVHKSWHNNEKNFSCDVCGTKFRTRGKMNTHRSIHGGPKKFMCHICSRDFRWKKDFEIHMRTHTGEKPFKCSHCGKAFASLTNMKKHEKNHMKKVEVDKITDKFEMASSSPNDGKFRRNEFLDFSFGSEDVRNNHTDQVSDSSFYLVCK